MKALRSFTLVGILLQCLTAGESALVTTFQPLDGLRSGQIAIVQVTCHHWHANSATSAVDLIALKNIPPTDRPEEANYDLNVASICGLKFSTSDLGAPDVPLEIVFDARCFDASKLRGYSKEDIIRASLECLRRCLPEKLKDTPVTWICAKSAKPWLSKIVEEFNSSPRSKPFYTPVP